MAIINDNNTPIERREGPDIIVKSLRWFGFIGWFLMVVALIIVEKAKPRTTNLFSTIFDADPNLRTYWDRDLVHYIFYLMIVGFTLSVAALVFNALRHKRKSDTYRLYLILLGVVSFIGMLIYLL